MLFFTLPGRENHKNQEINEVIDKIKLGDAALKDKFIDDYKPFILKVVSRTLNQYVDIENSEEFSVGLMAFNEAIYRYDRNRNSSFLNFSDQVIYSRIIDHIRSNQAHQKVYPFTYFEGQGKTRFEEKHLASEYNWETLELKEEIELFKKKLLEYGINIGDIIVRSPKHRDSLAVCLKIARMIAENEVWYHQLHVSKKLPMNDLLKNIQISKRTLERHRKMIISICVILKNDFTYTQSYIHQLEKEGRR